MVNCGSCGQEARDCVQCSSCSRHFDYQCSGITEAGYRKLGIERQAAWRCPSCKSGGSAISPRIISGESGLLPKPVTLDQVMQELRNIKRTVDSVSNIVAGIESIKSDVSELKTSMGQFTLKFQGLEERIHVIEQAQAEVLKLSDRILTMESDLNDKNQWMRLNNVEIKGVPMKDRENLFEIINKIGNKIQYPITKQNINFLARVPSRDGLAVRAKPIIVSFLSRYVKEDFVASARSFKKLIAADIDLPGTSPIFINDHLTVENKILLKKTKKLKEEKNFDFVWVKNCKIFARKNPGSKIITIKSEKDLLKMQ
ncbi:uncharacterized protein LOC126973973 [Leptidea sinapis]|uniref:uncharacterized protein LOC126973973 n=1 Tax=Leptidea sinapis TaxID=189913 RepID=UPI0021C413E8|nr:uncharacterized protein LOC126973973 [Leptidea sinapis]